MEQSNIHNNEITNKLNVEMLKLIQEQEAEINFLTRKLRNINSFLIEKELENHILATCLNIIGAKYNLSRQEKREIILQALEKIFPDIF